MAEPLAGEFDYVIVGAGSAGCVLANRLSADPSVRVLLLEAGGTDSYFWLHVPMALSKVIGNPKVDWCFRSEPEAGANGRQLPVPRGKGLGGSSLINAMCYVRGHAEDYDHWRQLGNAGWSWDDVLPFFREIESVSIGSDDVRGRKGEMSITQGESPWEIVRAWHDAAVQYGIPAAADFNCGDNEGVGFVQSSVHKGRRWSAAQAFLHPVSSRPNLTIVTHAAVRRVILRDRQARGIEFWHGGALRQVDALEEVILAAGAIGSPQILQVSGIGPAQVLGAAGVTPAHELGGVGENMRDHWSIRPTYRVRNTVTMNEWVSNPVRRYLMGAYYLATRSGPLSRQPPQVCAFTRSNDRVATPDLQFHVAPYSSSRVDAPIDSEPGFSSIIAVLRPNAVGHVRISSGDARAAPQILHNFLSTPESHRVAIDGLRISRGIVAQPALARFAVEETMPGRQAQSDDDLLAFARENIMSAFHQSGTCKMGPASDAMAVVDAELRVHGIAGLRVIDASVMPVLPSGNTNVPTMMIAAKGAQMILQSRRQRHVQVRQASTA